VNTDKTISIETRENRAPLTVAQDSWRERFRPKDRGSPGLVKRARNGGVQVVRRLRRTPEPPSRNYLAANGEASIDLDFTHELHHHAYRKPWCLGRDQFDYLLSRGLQPEHRVLDFGCGAMRVGIWLVAYLNAGRYFGIDPHYKSLEAATQYEIPLHGLADKHPRLLCDEGYACEHFAESFDFVLAFSVFNWLGREETCHALEHVCSTLKPEGRVVVYGDLPVPADELQNRFGLIVGHREAMLSKFLPEISEFTELVRSR
jgi:SAM-dependent methyltransferase